MNTDRSRDFLGVLTQFDEVGNLGFRRGKMSQPGGKIVAKRGGQFGDADPKVINQHLLLPDQSGFLQSVENRGRPAWWYRQASDLQGSFTRLPCFLAPPSRQSYPYVPAAITPLMVIAKSGN